LGEAST